MVNYLEPQLPAHARKTYSVVSPLSTHFKVVDCLSAGCEAMEFGWRSVIDERTPLGQQQAYFIRKHSGRKFTELVRTDDGATEFVFEPGQTCFATSVVNGHIEQGHQVRLERPEIYVVKDGDWRGNPRGTQTVRHSGPDAWLDDFGTHQQELADRLARG